MTPLDALKFDYKTTQDLDVEKLFRVLDEFAAELKRLDKPVDAISSYMPPQAH